MTDDTKKVERVLVKAMSGDIDMMHLMATLLANKNVHDIKNLDIIKANEVAAKIAKLVMGDVDALT